MVGGLVTLLLALLPVGTFPGDRPTKPVETSRPQLAPTPLTLEQADCGYHRLPEGFAETFDKMWKYPRANNDDAVYKQVAVTVAGCVSDLGLDPRLGPDLSMLTLSHFAMERSAALLRQRKLPPEALDQLLDIGEGHTNAARSYLTANENRAISAEFKRRGVNPDRISTRSWWLVDLYVMFTLTYWRKRADLQI